VRQQGPASVGRLPNPASEPVPVEFEFVVDAAQDPVADGPRPLGGAGGADRLLVLVGAGEAGGSYSPGDGGWLAAGPAGARSLLDESLVVEAGKDDERRRDPAVVGDGEKPPILAFIRVYADHDPEL